MASIEEQYFVLENDVKVIKLASWSLGGQYA